MHREQEKKERPGGPGRSSERGRRRTRRARAERITRMAQCPGCHEGGVGEGLAVSKDGWTGEWTRHAPVTAETATGSKEGQSPTAGDRRVNAG